MLKKWAGWLGRSPCSRNARPQKALVGRAQLGLSQPPLIIVIVRCGLDLGQGPFQGEESVLADSGRKGEITARVRMFNETGLYEGKTKKEGGGIRSSTLLNSQLRRNYSPLQKLRS